MCVWLSRSKSYIPVKVEYNTQYTRINHLRNEDADGGGGGHVRDVNSRNEDDVGNSGTNQVLIFTGTTHFSDATASTTCKISELQHATA